MKIFLSWSKEPSRTIARHLRDLIPGLIPGAIGWMSDEDVQKGDRWYSAIVNELEAAKTGIIVVTPQNLHEPWLYFEAGAISKAIGEGRVHPLICGLDFSDLPGPLSAFQATKFEKSDVLKLVLALNQAGTANFDHAAIGRVFERVWPGLESDVNGALAGAAKSSAKPASKAQAEEPPISPVLPALDERHVKTLKGMIDIGVPRVNPELVKTMLGVHPERAHLLLDELAAHGLLQKFQVLGNKPTFALSDAGRRFAADNGWF